MSTAGHAYPTPLFQGRLAQAVEPLRGALAHHGVYARLSSLPHLRAFMESHVFAVWDFMSLLKTLQQRLTCVTTPWQPPEDSLSARLINEIVLVEESDELADGRSGSHFEAYVRAMEEIGADTRPVQTFLAALRQGRSVGAALTEARVSSSTQAFVTNTMATIGCETHEVAASFLLGREAVIPLMFEQILSITTQVNAPTLNWYLQRHIDVDGDEHAPAGWQLLSRLCGPDVRRWRESEESAKRALQARRVLWDGVCESLEKAGHASVSCVF
jgi:Protein of unknown function (DUF3050)